MNAVVGFSLLTKQSNDLNEIHDYLDKVNVSSDILLHIINDLLDISKIEADKLNLRYINFDFHHSLTRMSIIYETMADTFYQATLAVLNRYWYIYVVMSLNLPMKEKSLSPLIYSILKTTKRR
jgi:signal transduction histidine kinase